MFFLQNVANRKDNFPRLKNKKSLHPFEDVLWGITSDIRRFRYEHLVTVPQRWLARLVVFERTDCTCVHLIRQVRID